jgi:hypothetical protein
MRKVGDKVRIRSKAWWDAQPRGKSGNVVWPNCSFSFVDGMMPLCGSIQIIEHVDEVGDFKLKGNHFWWADWMVEDVADVSGWESFFPVRTGGSVYQHPVTPAECTAPATSRKTFSKQNTLTLDKMTDYITVTFSPVHVDEYKILLAEGYPEVTKTGWDTHFKADTLHFLIRWNHRHFSYDRFVLHVPKYTNSGSADWLGDYLERQWADATYHKGKTAVQKYAEAKRSVEDEERHMRYFCGTDSYMPYSMDPIKTFNTTGLIPWVIPLYDGLQSSWLNIQNLAEDLYETPIINLKQTDQ